MERVSADDGSTVYVADDEWISGQVGPFFATYRSQDRSRKYGWYCDHCDSIDTAMDTMGRLKCNECGNLRKPEGWDPVQK
ncbi:DUF5816 domain-containing protein [Halanaeroarchaeum sulfurireducens]|uniref:GNAT family acetyltransferase n=1 Tax=Halanaeroarchaeum sulfurireducens TaxID=1604004 RepID=A0A0N9N636_9EURY|nr:DUF5816 domain-containing protein [Halanaeroarchaeum sulfurireducens]ALG82539.1 GNAT family acetyltransferase [Halanaeroarchaeum sulfurireducens]